MPKIDGLQDVQRGLEAAFARFGKAPKVRVSVGFDSSVCPYAMRVHEDLNMRHAPPTIAKFLEVPFRDNGPTYQAMIEEQVLRGQTLTQALMVAAVQLRFDALFYTPIDTGLLRSSIYTRVEEG